MAPGKGILVISLDFELYWGVRDLYSKQDYAMKWGGEREQIPRILDLFRQGGIHATWATVGLLFFKNKTEMLNGLPEDEPSYSDSCLSPYVDIRGDEVGEGEDDDPYHYAISLIEQIHATFGQRIASHTFSHFYCLEKGQSKSQFYSDLKAAVAAARKRGIPLESLVLPRNQVCAEYLDGLASLGFMSYRGNPKHRLYSSGYSAEDSLLRRVFRLADSYLNLTGHHTYTLQSVVPRTPLNLPASFFLRSAPQALRPMEPLRLKRILDGMTYAAKRGQVYHLWLHPYNAAGAADFRALERVVDHYGRLAERYGMTSLNMEELGDLVLS